MKSMRKLSINLLLSFFISINFPAWALAGNLSNESANSQAEYGIAPDYGSSSSSDNPLISRNNLSLTDLAASTLNPQFATSGKIDYGPTVTQGFASASWPEGAAYDIEGNEFSTTTAESSELFHRNGQTFITWKENANYFTEDITYATYDSRVQANSTVRYRIYRHTSPLTSSNLSAATRIAEVGVGSGYNRTLYGLQDKSSSRINRFVIQEGSGGWRPQGSGELPLNTGLYVYSTPYGQSGTYYYAVTTVIGGTENRNTFNNPDSVSIPISESYSSQWKPIIQNNPSVDRFSLYSPSGVQTIYTRWESEPLASLNSWPNNYMVVLFPGSSQPYRVDMSLHCLASSIVECHTWVYYPDGIFFTSTDYAPQTWWTGYNSQYRLPSDDCGTSTSCNGTNKYYTMNRMLSFLEWMKTQWPIDENRIMCSGSSMGGSGGKIFCLRHGEMFNYINSWVGVGIPSLSPSFKKYYEGVFGKVEQNPVNDSGALTWDDLDMSKWLRKNPLKETPFITFSNGKNDTGIGWAQAVQLLQALQETKRPFTFSWGQEGHSQRANDMAVNGFSDNAGSSRIDFQKNRALPAFTRFSLDDNPGNGDPANGDPSGCINCYQRWDPNTIIDQPAHFEMEMWLLSQAPGPGTGDVTLRNLQKFSIQPNTSFTWKLVEGLTTIKQGNGNADSLGLITVPGVSLTTARRKLIVDTGSNSPPAPPANLRMK